MSIGELAVILLVILLVIRPKQMPEIAFAVGRFLRTLRQAIEPIKQELDRQFKLGELDYNRKRAEKTEEERKKQGTEKD